MSKYINKSKAINIVRGCSRYTGIDEAPYEYSEALLEQLSTIDIVCCKDCIHFDKTETNHNGLHFCQWMGICRPENWFCADGERGDTE